MTTEFIRLFFADNIVLNPGSGGDTTAAKDFGGVKHQQVMTEFENAAGTAATRVSGTNPLPVAKVDITATGNITATDAVVAAPGEDGVPVTGVPTANSAVFCAAPGGDSAVIVQLIGSTFSGTNYFELSVDSTNGTDGNWIVVKMKQTGHLAEIESWKTLNKGIYRGNIAGATYFRVRNIAGTSPSINVVIRITPGTGATWLNAPLPEGSKNIGRVSIAEILPPNLQQLAIEGYPIIGSLQQTSTGYVSDNASIVSGTIKFADLGAGKAAWVEEIVITSAGGAGITWANVLNTGSFTFNPATETMYGDIPIEGGVVVQKVQRFMLEGSNLVVAMTTLDTGWRPRISIMVRGVSFTDDFNFDAKTLALLIGTSNDGDNMGIDPATSARYRNKWIHMWQVRDKMLDAGKSVRLINKAVVAAESDLWAKNVASGIFGGTNYDLLVVNLGMNDAITGSGISTTQFEANLKELIVHRNRFRPEASIIFMTPTPTDTSIRSGIASYRTSVANVANDATLGGTARRVYLCDVFAQWVTTTGQATGLNPTATADLNFNDAERSAGNRLHPSGAGMNITVIALWATVQTTHYYKNLA